MATQPGFVSFPAATKPGAGRMRASMNAHPARARAPQVRTRNSNPSNAVIPEAYPSDGPESGSSRLRPPPGGARRRQPTAQGPGALVQLRGPGQCDVRRRRQFFFAGTAVGFAGLAVRARVTRAEVAVAGEEFRAAGVVFLAGVPLVSVAFAVTGLAPEPGASTAFSAVALVLLAASSTLVSALSATLVARAAVFCATEVALLDTSTTFVALSSRTSSRVSSTVSTARSARRTIRRKPGC